MNVRRVRFSLWFACLAVTGAGSVGLVQLFTRPIAARHQQQAASTSEGVRAAPETADGILPTVGALQAVWSLDLRRPLFDPPPPPVVERPKPPPPPLTVRLIGTILEPNLNRALLVAADGKTQLRAVGEKVGDVEVLAIESDSVTLQHNGSPVVLKLTPAERTR